MTIDITSIILAADVAATEALAAAQQPVTVDPDEVDRILATLPAKAAEGLREKRYATTFTLWSGKGPTADAFASALHDRIAACLGSGRDREADGGHSVYLSFGRVALAARDIRVKAWIADVCTAWTKRGGTIEPYHDHRRGALNFADAQGLHTVTIDLARSPADVVEEAATALRMPLWTLDGLRTEWTSVAGQHCMVSDYGGWYIGSVYRAVQCLMFASGTDQWGIDLDDARALTAAELCSRAATALCLTVASKQAAPVNVHVATTEPVKAAPVVPHGQGNGKPGQGARR